MEPGFTGDIDAIEIWLIDFSFQLYTQRVETKSPSQIKGMNWVIWPKSPLHSN